MKKAILILLLASNLSLAMGSRVPLSPLPPKRTVSLEQEEITEGRMPRRTPQTIPAGKTSPLTPRRTASLEGEQITEGRVSRISPATKQEFIKMQSAKKTMQPVTPMKSLAKKALSPDEQEKLQEELRRALYPINIASAKQALDKGANPNLPEHNSLLAEAVSDSVSPGADEESIQLLQLLLDKKYNANINQRDSRGMSLLIVATSKARNNPKQITAVIKLLMQNGPDLQVRDEKGNTALDYAVSRGFPQEITDLLKKSGAQFSDLDINESIKEAIQKLSAKQREILQRNSISLEEFANILKNFEAGDRLLGKQARTKEEFISRADANFNELIRLYLSGGARRR